MQDDQIFERMRETTPGDFDGHTEFHRMSPEQRLAWLSSSVKFFYENARKLPPRLRPPDEAELEFWR